MFLIPSREFHQTKAGLGSRQLVGKPTKLSLLPPADLQHLRLPFFTSTLLCNISLLSSWATNYFFTSPTILSSTLPRPSHAFCQLQIFLIYQNLTQCAMEEISSFVFTTVASRASSGPSIPIRVHFETQVSTNEKTLIIVCTINVHLQ